MPKNNPTAASENATGNPISMNRIMVPNISGGNTPCENIKSSCLVCSNLLQRRLVMRGDTQCTGQRSDALGKFCESLQEQEAKPHGQQGFRRPEDQPARVHRHFLRLERIDEEWARQV